MVTLNWRLLTAISFVSWGRSNKLIAVLTIVRGGDGRGPASNRDLPSDHDRASCGRFEWPVTVGQCPVGPGRVGAWVQSQVTSCVSKLHRSWWRIDARWRHRWRHAIVDKRNCTVHNAAYLLVASYIAYHSSTTKAIVYKLSLFSVKQWCGVQHLQFQSTLWLVIGF